MELPEPVGTAVVLSRGEEPIELAPARLASADRLRVLVYDPVPLLAEALSLFLATQPDIDALGVSDLAEFLAGLAGSAAAVMFFRSWGARVTTALRCVRARSNVPLVLLGPDDPPPTPAFQVERVVHIREGDPSSLLPKAIRELCDTEPADELRRRRPSEDEKPGRAIDVLTPREREIISLIAEDLTSRQIATLLRVSERTIHSHLRNAYKKLGVHGRIGAVEAARREGLLGRPPTAVVEVS